MGSGNEQMMEIFLFEMSSLLEQLDEILLVSEKNQELTQDAINEIFRIMHTIKGSSAMMELDIISTVTHKLEDTFYFIRENGIDEGHFTALFDLMLEATDFLKIQLEAIQSGAELASENTALVERAVALLKALKEARAAAAAAAAAAVAAPAAAAAAVAAPAPAAAPEAAPPGVTDTPQNETPLPAPPAQNAGGEATPMRFEIFFEEDCGMENLRAFMLVNALRKNCNIFSYDPPDIEHDSETAGIIMAGGFTISLESSMSAGQVRELIEKSLHVKSVTPLPFGQDYGPVADITGERYEATVFFEDNCGMENLRAFMLVNSLRVNCKIVSFVPENIENDPGTASVIKESGLKVTMETPASLSELEKTISNAMYVKSVRVSALESAAPSDAAPADAEPSQALPSAALADIPPQAAKSAPAPAKASASAAKAPIKQSLISVSLDKLDRLMDLMGELVITESMVVRSPDLKGITKLDNFQKAERQLRKLTDELQDMVMSIRMIPVSATFQKMQRIVRDMCRALNKKADLVTMGEETDIDKTIIDGIADPIMHLVRNSMDHGIESPEERIAAGKPPTGTITLSAQNTGGEILITVSDDGRGLDAEKLLAKAKENGILTKPAGEYTEKEAFMLLCAPGFSTKEQVTEFSGRGVGMDVVKKNIEKIGGTVVIESKKGYGTSNFLKIPLTLAIVDGMDISVGGGIYTMQITSINESFKATKEQVITDTDGNEMIVIRGDVYPIIRLHELYNVPNSITDIEEGILIWVQSGERSVCLFADRLIGEQQIVVKPLPVYLNKFSVKPCGISGCTILGDGTISLILDVGSIIDKVMEKR